MHVPFWQVRQLPQGGQPGGDGFFFFRLRRFFADVWSASKA
jgi:hypothetical protein